MYPLHEGVKLSVFPEDTKYDKKMSSEECGKGRKRHLDTKMLLVDGLYGER